MTGVDLLKILRNKRDATPVIIFTGEGRENAAISALNNGADFFVKKGENPASDLRDIIQMINLATERKLTGRSLGASQKLLEETVNFFPDAAYAINREAQVIAWNPGMTALTGIAAKDIIGKGSGAHAVPFFGKAVPMLTELVFEKDDAIQKQNYTIIGREEGTLCAWIITRASGAERVLWMKATALHDSKGTFVAALGSVKDITNNEGQELLRQARGGLEIPLVAATAPSQGSMLGRIMGKGKSSHRDGLRLSYREGKYEEAIPFFDKAIEVDPTFAAAWHDRAVCLRELGRHAEALNNFVKAVELSPDDEEFLYSSADMLKRIGIQQGQKAYVDAASKAFGRVLEINPNNAEAWNSLGICMKELGKDVQAVQYFERSIDLVRYNKASKKFRNLDAQV